MKRVSETEKESAKERLAKETMLHEDRKICETMSQSEVSTKFFVEKSCADF